MKPSDLVFEPTRHVAKISDNQWQVFVTPPTVFELPTQTVLLTKDQYLRYLKWTAGETLIQEALPELSAADREILLTGIGNEDFQKATREDEDDG